MKNARNKRTYAVELAATGQLVEPDESVEVPDEVAKSLADQVDAWEVTETTADEEND